MPRNSPPGSLGEQSRGAVLGLGAAALFGLSAPLAKVLLGSTPPVLLAGLLYLGAALGLWIYRAARPPTREAALVRTDLPILAGIVFTGGLLGPVLMLLGLQRVSALSGSLLLNMESPFTVLIAVLIFREHLGAYGVAAVSAILAGATLLKLAPGSFGADGTGVLLLGAACLCWAVDNNLTQRLSGRDPFAIVRVKTLVAGVTNTTLGLLSTRGQIPAPRFLAFALVLGCLSYGLSVVMDAYALRWIGAAREAAYFATAPFFGALVSVIWLHDSLRWLDAGAMALMAVGVLWLLRERHRHLHVHEVMEHNHLHRHDAHHQHVHRKDDPPGEPHSHPHRHSPLEHDHPHVSDLHHRHTH